MLPPNRTDRRRLSERQRPSHRVQSQDLGEVKKIVPLGHFGLRKNQQGHKDVLGSWCAGQQKKCQSPSKALEQTNKRAVVERDLGMDRTKAAHPFKKTDATHIALAKSHRESAAAPTPTLPPNPNPPEEPQKPPKQKGRNSTEACSVRDPDFEDKMTWGRKPKVLALAQSTNDKVLRASCLAWRQLSTGARAFGVDAAVPSASRKKSHRTGAKVLPTVQVSCLG